jgi:beta-glucosidase
MAQAMIQGIQDVTDDDILPSSAAACGKHWLGYSFPHNGHDRAPSWIPRRHLYQYFLQPWRKVLQPSSNKPLLTIMESYSEMDGVPNVANRETLTKVLRRELGFEGMLVTDYHEIFNLYEWHHTAADRSDALKQSMTEGSVDMSMIANEPEDFFDGMKKLDAKGFGARIRESARRVLQLKQNLNMFEESFDLKPLPNDNKNDDKSTKSTISEKDLNIALEMTQQSIILTENKNNALPLNPQDDLKILITGPTSRSISFQSGGWTGLWQGVNSNTEDEWFTYGSTVLDAFQKEASSNGMWHITYECGTDNLGNDCQAHDNPDDNNGNLLDTVEEWVGWKDGHHEGIDSAINQAKNSDVVIVCLGEENYTEKPGDIRDLRLPTGQYELVTGIRSAARDQKIILVYFGGRPRLLDEAVSQVDAVLLGFLPGPLAGDSVAGIVSGRVNPNGRLPITYPKNQDLGGVPYLHAVSDMCTEGDGVLPHWNNVPCEVQWPFGHGLEYSQFEYSDIILNTDVLQHSWEKSGHSDLTASVTITNTGVMGGSTAILFFSFDEFRSTTPEYKRLRAYEKVWLEPGASKEVTVTIPLDDLKFVGPHDDSHYIFQDGLRFRVGVGASADCRADPGSNRCSDPVTIKTDKNYIAACEAACDLWEQSGCKTFTRETCRKECSSIHTRSSSQTGIQLNNDGWGWTYVSCLESLIWSEAWDSASCWKMTKLCRDVVNTAGMDELGAGAASRGFSPVGMSMAAIAMSLFAGIFAAVMIHLAIKGHFALKDSTAEFEAVATIEFV